MMLTACVRQEKSFGDQIKTDPSILEEGGKLFNRLCSPCHNFKQDGIGPQLGGLTRSVETDWIRTFLANPSKMIRDQDPRAASLFEEYQTYMPAYKMLTENEIESLLAFMHIFPFPETGIAQDLGLKMVKDPIPDTAVISGLVLNLVEVWQIPPSASEPPLARINQMTCEADLDRLFINDLRGKLYLLTDNGLSVYLDMQILEPHFIHHPGLGTGLGSFAFHPNFAQNGLLYTAHAEPPGSAPAHEPLNDTVPIVIQYVLKEWTCKDMLADSFSGTGRELLRMDMITGKHGIQQIAFNPTASPGDSDYGLLYIAIGDGASVEEGYPEYSYHNGSALWSSILRINPTDRSNPNERYGIPEDNPFAGSDSSNFRGEIWAYGFRNPNKLHWDLDGRMYATDIGLRQIEEVNLIEKGGFYGWPIREGRFFLNHKGNMSRVYELPEDDEREGVSYPVIELDHDESRAIIGGLMYELSAIPQLTGKYVFGDIISGKLFYAPIDQLQGPNRAPVMEWQIAIDGQVTSLQEMCGSSRVDLRFGQDCEGRLFLFTKADGKIYEVKARLPS